MGIAGIAFITLMASAMGASPATPPAPTASAMPVVSADRDHPTPLASNELQGDLDGIVTEAFYSVLAGPGDLVITVDVKASDGIANLSFELLDKDAANSLMSSFAQADGTGQTARKIETVKLDSNQTVVLLLRKSGKGTFTMRLSGTAAIEKAKPSAQTLGGFGFPDVGKTQFDLTALHPQILQVSSVELVSVNR
ncbi:MAG TPA: hypothetical protein VLR94_04005 [Acidobacteriota bacterium]|nr:hypothetical protein [Acidobacteriota bacterium]